MNILTLFFIQINVKNHIIKYMFGIGVNGVEGFQRNLAQKWQVQSNFDSFDIYFNLFHLY